MWPARYARNSPSTTSCHGARRRNMVWGTLARALLSMPCRMDDGGDAATPSVSEILLYGSDCTLHVCVCACVCVCVRA
jgi:hypothetical protein